MIPASLFGVPLHACPDAPCKFLWRTPESLAGEACTPSTPLDFTPRRFADQPSFCPQEDTACNGMAPPSRYNNLFELMERTQTSQRRRRQTMINLASAMFSDTQDERGLYGGYLGAKTCRVRMDWEQHLSEVTNREFFALYRVDQRSFHRFLAKVEAVDGSSERPRPVGPPWAPVEAPLRLAMALRWLAGCRYIGISTMCHISTGHFYTILWDTIDRISTALAIVSPYEADEVRSMICSGLSLMAPLLNILFLLLQVPGEPDQTEFGDAWRSRMDDLSSGFEGLCAKGSAFKGCVGALDGILIPMQSRGKSVPNLGSYYSSRKGYFAILVNLHP